MQQRTSARTSANTTHWATRDTAGIQPEKRQPEQATSRHRRDIAGRPPECRDTDTSPAQHHTHKTPPEKRNTPGTPAEKPPTSSGTAGHRGDAIGTPHRDATGPRKHHETQHNPDTNGDTRQVTGIRPTAGCHWETSQKPIEQLEIHWTFARDMNHYTYLGAMLGAQETYVRSIAGLLRIMFHSYVSVMSAM